jgi:Zn ribbon nucleic-acid-binding protein
MVECLNCGKRRQLPETDCPRCGYVGWAFTRDLDESLRRLLRERTLVDRRIRVAS